MHSEEFVQKMKERLLEEKERVTEELADLDAHTERGDDAEENIQEMEVDQVNQDIIAQLKGDMEKIDSALTSIEKGTYGVTAEGEIIPEARLEVIPWADTNVE